MLSAEAFESWRKRIWDELVGLHDAWHQYMVLFGHSAERVAMLNGCARWFFGTVQRGLLREVVLGVSRLTDPMKVRGRSNLVITSLLSNPALKDYPAVRMELRRAINEAVTAAQPLRVHRNKYIAHLDHDTALGAVEDAIPGLKRETIDNAVSKLEAAYQVPSLGIRQSHTFFEMSPTGNAEDLLNVLEASPKWIRVKELRQRQLKGRA